MFYLRTVIRPGGGEKAFGLVCNKSACKGPFETAISITPLWTSFKSVEAWKCRLWWCINCALPCGNALVFFCSIGCQCSLLPRSRRNLLRVLLLGSCPGANRLSYAIHPFSCLRATVIIFSSSWFGVDLRLSPPAVAEESLVLVEIHSNLGEPVRLFDQHRKLTSLPHKLYKPIHHHQWRRERLIHPAWEYVGKIDFAC